MVNNAITRRTAAVLTAALLPTLGGLAAAAPAQADTEWTYRSSGKYVQAHWVERGRIEDVKGNWHVGYLSARKTSSEPDVYGYVVDYACERGEEPNRGRKGRGCDVKSYREIRSTDDLVLRIDSELKAARLKGTVTIKNYDADDRVRAAVDITWTGDKVVYTRLREYTRRGDGKRYRVRNYREYRRAQIEGSVGAMNFTDDDSDSSRAKVVRYRQYEHFIED